MRSHGPLTITHGEDVKLSGISAFESIPTLRRTLRDGVQLFYSKERSHASGARLAGTMAQKVDGWRDLNLQETLKVCG